MSAPGQGGVELAERLRERREEIEAAVLARVHSVSNPPAGTEDPLYVAGLRSAVSAAVTFGIAGLEEGGERPDPIPAELLRQARHAARRGVPLDTVLRRYFAGQALLGEFVFAEAEAIGLSGSRLRRLMAAQAGALDHLVEAVGREYRAEAQSRSRSSRRRREEQVERLLAGEPSKLRDLNYDFDGWHLGMVLVGEEDERALHDLAASLDRRLLSVPRGEGTAWAWLGGARKNGPREMDRIAAAEWPSGARVAIGEPGQGLAGWRLTHRQAAAALPVALRGPSPLVRYADVALLAAALGDETLTSSLGSIYLDPLNAKRDEGMTLRETLRAYFHADRTLSSAAAALGVTRHTVTNRLRAVEDLLGRPLSVSAPQVEIALRLEELADGPKVKSST